jgi:ribonucleoside-diphosphate reductase alpha chain
MAKATRRIGLGEMGWADLFIKLGIRYGSQESLDLIDKVKSFIKRIAEDESEYIARKKGSFPKHNVSKFNTPRRNAAISTEAPTGSLSLFAGVSSGIEPVFSYIVERKNSCGTGTIIHQDFMDYIKRKYDAKSVEYIIQWVKDNGTIQNCPYVDDETKHIFVTALDISPVEHINVQATFQKYTDASISKTLNLPESTTVEQIVDIIRYAWEQKLKGLTIYRQNSRDIVVYDINKKSDDKIKLIEITNPVKYKLVTANGRVLPKTPREMPATLVKKNSGCGKMMIAIGEAFGGPHSVTIVNKGGCDAMTQALAELTALALRWGIPGTDIVKTLKGIKCSAALKNPNSDGKSCPDILGKVIDELYEFDDMPDKKDKVIEVKPKHTKQFKISCPECGESLIFESGCVSCSACGYSRCG